MTDVDWDERYKGPPAERPWDAGVPDAELASIFSELAAPPGRALEIGCGTGTDALWLACRGVHVLGIDLSAEAIRLANERLAGTDLPVEFRVCDFLREDPVPEASVDLVLDRGVFHVIKEDAREVFVGRVQRALVPDGIWLTLCGSADETKPPDRGPPRLTAAELTASVEPAFSVLSLRRSHFELPDGSRYLAWLALLQKRPGERA